MLCNLWVLGRFSGHPVLETRARDRLAGEGRSLPHYACVVTRRVRTLARAIALVSAFAVVAWPSIGVSARATRHAPDDAAAVSPLIVRGQGVFLGSRQGNLDLRLAYWGAVLHNRTADDLRAVRVTWTLSTDGRVVGRDTSELIVIPAKSDYYIGGETVVPADSGPLKLKVTTKVGGPAQLGWKLPAVSRVSIADLPGGQGFTIRGTVRNDHKPSYGAYAEKTTLAGSVTAVLFDKRGNVVGGVDGDIVTLAPLTSGPFRLDVLAPRGRIASVRVSVDRLYQ